MVKVSIIIPVKNGGDGLYETVQSVLEQSMEGVEVILVDNASTDHSRAIIEDCCQQFPEDIRGVYPDTDRGFGGARNAGLAIARGEYVGFIGQHDRLHADLCRELYEAAQGADMVGADYEENGSPYRVYYGGDLAGEAEKARFINACGCMESRLYRRGFLEENNLRFPENNRFDDQYWNFMTALLASSAAKAEGIWYFRKSESMKRNDETLYERLEIPGLIMQACRDRGVYAAFKDLIDYKYIALQMGNIRLICLGQFDRPDERRLGEIRGNILRDCPDYAGGAYYERTLWKMRYYLEKLMESPAKAVKAYKNDGWVEMQAAIRDRLGKN